MEFDDDFDRCSELEEVCFADYDCCYPYVCNSSSMYCERKRDEPVPSPTPRDDRPQGSFSFGFEDDYDDTYEDTLWDTYVPAPSPGYRPEAPVVDPDLSYDMDEPTRPTDDRPRSDEDCYALLTSSMEVSRVHTATMWFLVVLMCCVVTFNSSACFCVVKMLWCRLPGVWYTLLPHVGLPG